MINKIMKSAVVVAIAMMAALVAAGCGDGTVDWRACGTYAGIDKDNDGIDDGCDPCLGDKENKCAQESNKTDSGSKTPDAGVLPKQDSGTTPPTPDAGSPKQDSGSTGTCHVWKSTGQNGGIEVWIKDLTPMPLKATLRCEQGKVCNLKTVATNPHALGVWVLVDGRHNAVNFQTAVGGWWDLSHCTYGSGVLWQVEKNGGYVYIK